ncbi:MAG: hypothetical protein QNJ46_20840 [Leptolyngbyaceae cyanobacterium MO_188.B28]|nr:hypothetical protein [Leptolyngbyaceae cyanobacterium MO_188.B28]
MFCFGKDCYLPIGDYTQAIRIQPDYAAAYYNRGVNRSQVGDQQAGLTDIEQASRLAQKQNNIALYQQIQREIIRLQP